MEIVLGPHEYGKAETRLVRVDRDGDRHDLHDLNVSVALRGDLAASHLTGDNAAVLPTDSQKNTVYAFAGRYGVGQPESFGLRLARHFVDSQPTIAAARVHLEEYPWQRLGPHSFARQGHEVRTAVVTYDGESATVVAGLTGLTLLNSTDSEFTGFIEDPYTTLPPTTDRILATSVNARWRHADAPAEADWAGSYAGVRAALVGAFADTYSRSLQQTLYAMGQRVLADRPEIVEVRLSLPNRHHLLVDLRPFGQENPNQVFVAADRPYGLIEGTVSRAGAPDAGLAWW
jgi:urate oxidase